MICRYTHKKPRLANPISLRTKREPAEDVLEIVVLTVNKNKSDTRDKNKEIKSTIHVSSAEGFVLSNQSTTYNNNLKEADLLRSSSGRQ